MQIVYRIVMVVLFAFFAYAGWNFFRERKAETDRANAPPPDAPPPDAPLPFVGYSFPDSAWPNICIAANNEYIKTSRNVRIFWPTTHREATADLQQPRSTPCVMPDT